jgi:hypothetical protein
LSPVTTKNVAIGYSNCTSDKNIRRFFSVIFLENLSTGWLQKNVAGDIICSYWQQKMSIVATKYVPLRAFTNSPHV